MDKSCQSSGESTSITTGSNSSTSGRDHYLNLKHLNKLSHKISKPIIKKPTAFDPSSLNHQNHNQNQTNFNHHQPQPKPPLQPQPPPAAASSQTQQQNLQAQQQQHQPPVYNINKNDFRDVVQKLTGSPAHERFSTPPPIHPPKPPSSRLQRIRPPPLVHVSNRPPPLLNNAVPPQQPPPTNGDPNNPIPTTSNFGGIGRPVAPLSPLPPLPTVHAAAESPVSAYLRYLQNSVSAADPNQKQFSGFSPLTPLVSPRWSNLAPHQPLAPLPPPQQHGVHHSAPPPAPAMIPSQSQFPMPSSPLPFGCLNSPRSPRYPLLSPSLLLSPSSGQLGFPQLPLSPTVPLPSPRWRGF